MMKGKREEEQDIRREFLKMKSSLIDKNTDLPSFHMLFDDIRNFLNRRRQIGIIHIETSNLAMVESLYGWQVFENIMRKVSIRLKNMKGRDFPKTSLLSINGAYGDKFIIFIPETKEGEEIAPESLLDIMDRISSHLSEEFFSEEYLGMATRLSFNIGCSILKESPFYRLQRLISHAIEEARRVPLEREERKNVSMAIELKRMIKDEDIVTVFQSIINVKNREVIGYEAFSRGPKGSIFENPGVMFAVSQRAGLSSDLDKLCWNMAMKNASELPHGTKLFINFLPESLYHPEWLSTQMEEYLWSSDIPLKDFVLELPERVFMESSAILEKGMKQLRQKGFSISFDDIGTGYASFQKIADTQPDYLKIDKTLIHDVDKSLIKQDIMKSIVQISKRTGTMVIAEGVETEKELEFIDKMGIRLAQGFYFSYPVMSLAAPKRTMSKEG